MVDKFWLVVVGGGWWWVVVGGGKFNLIHSTDLQSASAG